MVDLEEAKKFIEERLASEGHKLSPIEAVALEAAWERKTYAKASDEKGVNLNTLQAFVAPQLWRKLSKIYSERITKANFKEIFERIIAQERTPILADEQQLDTAEMETVDTQSAACTVPVVGATLPSIDNFYGREKELQDIGVLLKKYSCLLVVGAEGIGKKTLVSQFLQSNALPYLQIIWKPLHHRPTDLEAELLQLLDGESNSSLISYLKVQKSLIVMESIDSMITQQNGLSDLDPTVTSLIRRIAEETESKLVLISNEPIEQVRSMMLRGNTMTYPLRGLTLSEAEALMGNGNGCLEKLWESTGGNPAMLRRIKDWQRSNAANLSHTMAHRLTVHAGLLNGLHDRLFYGKTLSTLDRNILRAIAAQGEIPFGELLSLHPGAAYNIQRLFEMGVVTEPTSDPKATVRVYEFLRRYILEKDAHFIQV